MSVKPFQGASFNCVTRNHVAASKSLSSKSCFCQHLVVFIIPQLKDFKTHFPIIMKMS